MPILDANFSGAFFNFLFKEAVDMFELCIILSPGIFNQIGESQNKQIGNKKSELQPIVNGYG